MRRYRSSSRSCCSSFSSSVFVVVFSVQLLCLFVLLEEVVAFPLINFPALKRTRHHNGASFNINNINMAADDESAAFTTATTMDDGAEEHSSVPRMATSSPSPSIRELQKRAGSIASSFRTHDDFDPMIVDGHLQTLLPFFLRDYGCNYVPKNKPIQAFAQIVRRSLSKKNKDDSSSGSDAQRTYDDDSFWWDERERISTPDGDFFHADTKYAVGRGGTTTSATPTVILMHGLQSNSNSSLSKELARGFNMQGMHSICLNFRGCSGEMNDKFGGYHLGYTDDLIHYIKLFRERQRQEQQASPSAGKLPPLYLSGFSLGANVVLKCLGELGDKAYLDYGIAGAAVSGAPFDQTKNYKMLAKPGSFHRLVYSNSLLDSLKQRLVDQFDYLYEKYPDVNIDYDAAMAATTIMEYEDEVIAPLYNFNDHIDYYEQTSCLHFLETNAVPTFIVNADDDPFFDPSVWPIDRSCVNGGKAPIQMRRTRSGGHLGFAFHQVDPDDERLNEDVSGPWPSWASWEIARFLNHVHEQEKLIDDAVLIR